MTEMPPRPTKSASPPVSAPEGQRKVSFLLGLGIFLVPIVFAWFLLRKGHSTLSRILGFGWLGLFLILALIPQSPDNPSAPKPVASAPPTPEEIAKTKEEAEAEAAAAALREVRRNPERSLTFAKISGQKGGFDTVLVLNGTIKNSSAYTMKDADIKCVLLGPSGTEVGIVRETLYEVFPAQQLKRFRELNMGFMGSSQVANFNCDIVGATLVGP